MTIEQLKQACEVQINLGNGDSLVSLQRSDKNDLPNGDYRAEVLINHYDDGMAIIVDEITEK